jgi:UDP-N-acetylglucosamine acyltransferase
LSTQIHPTALVDPQARIGPGCRIGPYCVIGPEVELGAGCHLHAHVVISGHTILGEGNEIFPFAALGGQTQDLKFAGGTPRLRIGRENTFRESVTVNVATADGDETVIGSHNHILAYSHVAHDVVLRDHIVMSNVATLAGHVTVEDYAVIGGVVAIHQFCRIGKHSMIGGCSKVVQDVPPYMMADGNPAETRTVNKIGLTRHGISADVQTALRQAYKILFRDGLTIPNALARLEQELGSVPEVLELVRFVRESKRGIGR